MSVQIEREPAIEPIRKIEVSCNVFPKDSLELYFDDLGGITAEIHIHRDDTVSVVEISPDDVDTLLQAFAELRRDRATTPF